MTVRRIFIAGASGFVGRSLIRTARETGSVQVMAGVRDLSTVRDLDIEAIAVDVTRNDSLGETFRKIRPDVVINATAYGVRPDQQDSDRALAVNTAGAVRLLESAASVGCQRFIQLGSCSEYGALEGRVSEDTPCAPSSLYGSTKAAASILLQERGASLGIETLVLRLFNIWGEDEPGHRLFPELVAACLSGRPLPLTDGNQLKDYSYVGDMAAWILALAMKSGTFDNRVINIASGHSRPLNEFIQELADLMGCGDLLRFGEKTNRMDEARSQIPVIDRFEALLPDRTITPVPTALERALSRMSASASVR